MRISSINFATIKPKKTFVKNNVNQSAPTYFNQAQNINFKANLNMQDTSLVQEINNARKNAQKIYLRTQEVKQNAHKIKDEAFENIAQLQRLARGKSRYSIKANNVRYTYQIKEEHDDEYVKFWKECQYRETTDGVVTKKVTYNINSGSISIWEFDPETNTTNDYFFTCGNLQNAQIGFCHTGPLFGNFEKIKYGMFDGKIQSYKKYGISSDEIDKFVQWDDNEELSMYASNVQKHSMLGDFEGRFLCFNNGLFDEVKTFYHIY